MVTSRSRLRLWKPPPTSRWPSGAAPPTSPCLPLGAGSCGSNSGSLVPPTTVSEGQGQSEVTLTEQV